VYLQVIWVFLTLFRLMLGVTMTLLWALSSGSRTMDKVYCRHKVFIRVPGQKPPVAAYRTAAWNDNLTSSVAGISSARSYSARRMIMMSAAVASTFTYNVLISRLRVGDSLTRIHWRGTGQ